MNALMYEVFISNRTDEANIESLAQMSGMAKSTLHEYATDGRKTVPADVLVAAFVVSGDRRFISPIERFGYRLVRREDCPPDLGSAEAEGHDVVAAMEDAIRVLRKAKSPDSPGGTKVTPREWNGVAPLLETFASEAREFVAAAERDCGAVKVAVLPERKREGAA